MENDFYSALDKGDVEQAKKWRPESLTAKGGPRNFAPLVYVCLSRDGGEGLLETAKWLLANGADPNTSYDDPQWPANPLSCLYAASGLNNNVALTKLLLEAGANPNDGESLYHSTEHADLQCMKLLLAHGAKGNNALKHILDYEHEEGVRLLLEAGADPNELNERGETALHWAVRRERSARVLAALVRAGVNVDAKRADGRTAFALAKMNGQAETVMFLHRSGADMTLSPVDALLGACAQADGAGVKLMISSARPPLPLAAEYAGFLVEFAANNNAGGLQALLEMGVPVDARGEHGGTALHWACWKGNAKIVKVLLERGASLSLEDYTYHATPVGWFEHGLRNANPAGDYAEVRQMLIGAGALNVPVLPLGG